MSAMVPPRVVDPNQCCRCPAITEPVRGYAGTRWAYAEVGIK